jgi:hypothetical protein
VTTLRPLDAGFRYLPRSTGLRLVKRSQGGLCSSAPLSGGSDDRSGNQINAVALPVRTGPRFRRAGLPEAT